MWNQLIDMGWVSFDGVRFDLGPLLQGPTWTAKLKSAYNSLIICLMLVIEHNMCNTIHILPNCWHLTNKPLGRTQQCLYNCWSCLEAFLLDINAVNVLISNISMGNLRHPVLMSAKISTHVVGILEALITWASMKWVDS